MSKKNETEIYSDVKHIEIDVRTFFADVLKVASMTTPLLWPNFNIISDYQGV